jgi:hypothetical protein
MCAKKPVSTVDVRISRRQLDSLYARRTAIDALIQSLEDYDRCRAKRLAGERRNRMPATLLRAV